MGKGYTILETLTTSGDTISITLAPTYAIAYVIAFLCYCCSLSFYLST